MLTPIDVHFLVGFLSGLGQPEDVELELGSRVWDRAGEKERDVDVTMTRRGANGVDCYRGIEVKKERRPNDIELVEQLCMKLNDMPDLTSRAIVSASGYTDGARKKARHHGVELLRLDEWEEASKALTELPRGGRLHIRSPKWNVRLDHDLSFPKGARFSPSENYVVFEAGKEEPTSLQAFQNGVLRYLADQLKKRPEVGSLAAGTPIQVDEKIALNRPPSVWMGSLRGQLLSMRVTGTFCWKEEQPSLLYRRLLRDHDDGVLVESAVAVLSNGDLFTLASDGPKRIVPMHLPISERNLKTIREYRWTSRR